MVESHSDRRILGNRHIRPEEELKGQVSMEIRKNISMSRVLTIGAVLSCTAQPASAAVMLSFANNRTDYTTSNIYVTFGGLDPVVGTIDDAVKKADKIIKSQV